MKKLRNWVLVIVIVIIGYFVVKEIFTTPSFPDWTGLDGKTAWDLLDLAIIPIVLAFMAALFKRLESERVEKREALEGQLEEDRQREAALESYLEHMKDLLIEKQLLKKSQTDEELRAIAETLTVVTMRRLDAKRNETLLRFLNQAGVIAGPITKGNPPVFDFERADLGEIDLRGAVLPHIDLRGANLERAKLEGAYLWGADLSKANLWEANLSDAVLWRAKRQAEGTRDSPNGAHPFRATLSGALLVQAVLVKADLREADLREANLWIANLRGANLREARLNEAYLSGADLRGARLNGADLSGADLRGAKLTRKLGVEWFFRSDLERDTDLGGTKYNRATKWPKGFAPPPEAINLDEEQV